MASPGPAGIFFLILHFANTTTALVDGEARRRLHFVPWHRGSGCLGAAAPVTGAAADEHNLKVVDCDAGVPPAAGGKRER